MPKFTLELTYELPVYVHRTIEADTLEAAIAYALDNEDWDKAKKDYDSSGPTYVTGAWAGDQDHVAGAALTIPAEHSYQATTRTGAYAGAIATIINVEIEVARHGIADMEKIGDENAETIAGCLRDQIAALERVKAVVVGAVPAAPEAELHRGALVDAQRMSERFTALLQDPHWKPMRAHIESARNMLVIASTTRGL